jgi:hypothetical protein
LAKGGNLSAESPAVRRLCLELDVKLRDSGSGGNGEGTTLTATGGDVEATAFISILRPSRTITSSPIFPELPFCTTLASLFDDDACISKLIVEF